MGQNKKILCYKLYKNGEKNEFKKLELKMVSVIIWMTK